MHVSARVKSQKNRHDVTLSTDGESHPLAIPPRRTGFGSSVSGGELLALALATCFCNDLYREAAAQGVEVRSVDVEVEARFGGVGEPARQIRYRTRISADAPEEVVRRLAAHTDRVAEVHATLRLAMPVQLDGVEIEPVASPIPPG